MSMRLRLTENFLTLLKKTIFQYIGDKIRPGSVKGLMDRIFVIIEKVAFNFEKIAEYYLGFYEEMIEQELSMLNVTSNKKILVIGSGSLPVTPILIARKTKAKILCLDIDRKAVQKSVEYINKIELSNQIQIKHSDGDNYPVKDFDIIFMLYGIRKQKDMLIYLSKNMDMSSSLIYRTTTLDDKIRIDYSFGDLSEWFEIKNHIKTRSFGEVDSFLLKKKVTGPES